MKKLIGVMFIVLAFLGAQVAVFAQEKMEKEGEKMEIGTIILITLIAFIGYSEDFLGTTLISRPIVLGPLVGLILGHFTTGVITGATLELVFIGVMSIDDEGGAGYSEIHLRLLESIANLTAIALEPGPRSQRLCRNLPLALGG